jgi:hypothetical protein
MLEGAPVMVVGAPVMVVGAPVMVVGAPVMLAGWAHPHRTSAGDARGTGGSSSKYRRRCRWDGRVSCQGARGTHVGGARPGHGRADEAPRGPRSHRYGVSRAKPPERAGDERVEAEGGAGESSTCARVVERRFRDVVGRGYRNVVELRDRASTLNYLRS